MYLWGFPGVPCNRGLSTAAQALAVIPCFRASVAIRIGLAKMPYGFDPGARRATMMDELPVVVTFHAEWCGDGKKTYPHLSAMAIET